MKPTTLCSRYACSQTVENYKWTTGMDVSVRYTLTCMIFVAWYLVDGQFDSWERWPVTKLHMLNGTNNGWTVSKTYHIQVSSMSYVTRMPLWMRITQIRTNRLTTTLMQMRPPWMFGYLHCRTHLGIRLCIHSGLELYTVFRQFSGLVVCQLAGANATNQRAHPKFYLSWTTSVAIIQSQSQASLHMMMLARGELQRKDESCLMSSGRR